MVYSDYQTRNMYIVTGSAGVAKKAIAGTDKFRLNIHEGGNAASTASNVTATTDVITKSLIKDVRVSTPKGIATRTWTVAANSVTANKDYKLYFYVENVMGFGMQDRWDNVAHYHTSSTTASDLYKGLCIDLYNKIGKAGLLKDDFKFYVTTSGSDVEAKDIASNTSATGIKIVETTVTANEMDIRMHNFPYKYDVTISGSYDSDDKLWIYDSSASKEIRYAAHTTSYGHNGVVIADMEHYFNRNRADLYDLYPDFYTSILNKSYANLSGDYSCVDVRYAHKDESSFDYSSDKDLTIAVSGTIGNVPAFDATVTYVGGEVVSYSSKTYVMKAHTAGAWDADDATEVPVSYAEALIIAELFK